VQSCDEGDDLEILDREECLHLLGTHHFGRIAFYGASWPVILPVNYVFDEPSLMIRTAPGEKLEFVPMTVVAFEVDDADPAGSWGWSVLVQGPAFDITESTDVYSARLRSLEVTPWAPGRRDHWLKLSAVTVTGRRFGQV
jgi:nitroimidazol reductase NimA-like FMN-containing flavoprotein (pyridoxamine 5'-phosphate oxidase superfamily)